MTDTRYIGGVDFGLTSHRTAIAVINVDSGTVAELCTIESPYPDVVKHRVRQLIRTYAIDALWCDSGPHLRPVVDMWQAEGIPLIVLQSSRKVKERLFEALQAANSRGVLALPDPITDDEREAIALAWHGATHRGSGISFV